jgi:hypothetical protein
MNTIQEKWDKLDKNMKADCMTLHEVLQARIFFYIGAASAESIILTAISKEITEEEGTKILRTLHRDIIKSLNQIKSGEF